MKKFIALSFFLAAFILGTNAEDPKVVKLTQTEGKFEITKLTLKPGTYTFEVTNDGVDHEVGFVLVPKGATSQEDHIKSAYLKSTIGDGDSSVSGEVTLEAGEYEYFCPLNPTPRYVLVVE